MAEHLTNLNLYIVTMFGLLEIKNKLLVNEKIGNEQHTDRCKAGT